MAGGIVLGGKNARFQRMIGDIVVSFQYINGERAMCLWPKINQKRVPAFIVCDSAAWKYDNPRYLAQQAKQCCDLWGEAHGTRRWYAIAKIIHEGLGDLVRLPPAPQLVEAQGPSIGEISLLVDGKVVSTGEVTAPDENELDAYARTRH